jgi:glycosyltransferase involved in cell wall biosynthesis
MKLLIATDRDFWKADIGSRRRIAQLCSYLTGTSLDVYLFLTFGANYTPDEIEAIRQQFGFRAVRVYTPEKPGGLFARLKSRVGRLMTRDSCHASKPADEENTLADFKDNKVKIQFDRFVEEISPDFILVEYIRLAYLADPVPRGIKTIIDTHDVMHLRYESFKKAGKSHWIKISKAEEVALLNRFDSVLAIQKKEKSYFQSILDQSTAVLHAGMDTTLEFLPEPADGCLKIGFIGAHGDPNILGISTFVEKVWPELVRSTDRKLKLYIAGSICDVLPREEYGPDIVLLGRVADLKDFYGRTTIIINPVTFGGGLKIKTVEALAYGKPLVSTPVGAVGLEDGVGTAFLVAENDGEFLDRLMTLTGSARERQELAKGAFSYAQKHFSPEVVYRELAAYLGI